ncbi:methionyl aminopeptidase [Arboricoccus pini]|uniref:Methionine aminopeptidase n=2 Tax=Arboricoccus pini TaxID=1963835 RepID=A0A212RCM5_9PROT|nr:methionyl aminopeptidase [Arboricoccus pini]
MSRKLSAGMKRTVIDTGGTNRPVHLYEPADFAAAHRAGNLAARTLDFITAHVREGISTAELDRLIDTFMRDHGGVPATLGYKGYPASSCISINEVVNHGIPSEKRRLREGDTLNIDVTVILDGWYGDTSRMFHVGSKIPVKRALLTERTFESMWAGINAVRPGATMGDIGAAIQAVAEENRKGRSFSVVRDFVGHGVGREFHEPPEVRHYGKPGQGLVLEPGMIFTIEPMINAGTWQVRILDDGWTTVTKDREPSAQFEHMLGVTEEGYEIFTLSPAGFDKPPYGVP